MVIHPPDDLVRLLRRMTLRVVPVLLFVGSLSAAAGVLTFVLASLAGIIGAIALLARGQ